MPTVKRHQRNVASHLDLPYLKLNVERLLLTITMLERVKQSGGNCRIGQWQDPSPHLPGYSRLTTEAELIANGIGADLGGWLAVSPEFAPYGYVTNDGRPFLRDPGVDGEYALAEWLGIPVEIAGTLVGISYPGYYDSVYDKPADKVTIDDTLAALYRLRDTGNPGQ